MGSRLPDLEPARRRLLPTALAHPPGHPAGHVQLAEAAGGRGDPVLPSRHPYPGCHAQRQDERHGYAQHTQSASPSAATCWWPTCPPSGYAVCPPERWHRLLPW